MFIIFSQLRQRSVLIAQQPVSTFQRVFQTETFHFNNIFQTETFHFNNIVFFASSVVSFSLHALPIVWRFSEKKANTINQQE